ncbi:MAG: EscU/YscU/HrcU family type III secretion system export apparatus switch protein [Campylobacterales bacterium]
MDHQKKAAALRYNQTIDRAPKVLASGQGKIALRILEKAKEFEVPIFQNETLANSLMGVEIGEEISPELYKAVVEVFIWLNKTQQKAQMSQE